MRSPGRSRNDRIIPCTALDDPDPEAYDAGGSAGQLPAVGDLDTPHAPIIRVSAHHGNRPAAANRVVNGAGKTILDSESADADLETGSRVPLHDGNSWSPAAHTQASPHRLASNPHRIFPCRTTSRSCSKVRASI